MLAKTHRRKRDQQGGVNSETDLHPCHIYPSEALGLTRCKQSMPLGVSADKNAATSYSTAKYGIDRSGTINLPVR